MSHPEFILEEDEPQTPYPDGTDEDPEVEGLEQSGENPGESSPLNQNNNAAYGDRAEDVNPEPEGHLESFETSVWPLNFYHPASSSHAT